MTGSFVPMTELNISFPSGVVADYGKPIPPWLGLGLRLRLGLGLELGLGFGLEALLIEAQLPPRARLDQPMSRASPISPRYRLDIAGQLSPTSGLAGAGRT